MNAYVSKEELALLPANRISYPEHFTEARSLRAGANPFARLAARLSAYLRRQSVVNELAGLTDRELADIGLNRAEIGRVFDPAFARR